jgi:hypothetical protein
METLMSFQAYLDAIEMKMSVTPAELPQEAADRGLDEQTKAGDVVTWLKDDYDLDGGHELALCSTSCATGRRSATCTSVPRMSTATSRRPFALPVWRTASLMHIFVHTY